MNHMTTDSNNAPWNDTDPTVCECGGQMEVEHDDYERETTYYCPECGDSYVI
jgi:predicted RNA-binding Zn-ribbon protein involved in translation (DUF1610 family)